MLYEVITVAGGGLEHLEAHQGMGFHLLELALGEPAGLVDHLVPDGELAEIVEGGGHANPLGLVLAEPQAPGENPGYLTYPLDVVPGLLGAGFRHLPEGEHQLVAGGLQLPVSYNFV